jgi:hypothetical protein
MPFLIQSSKDMYMRIIGVEKKNEGREKAEDKQKEEDTKSNTFMPMNMMGLPHQLTYNNQNDNNFNTMPSGGGPSGFSGFGGGGQHPNQGNKLPFIG